MELQTERLLLREFDRQDVEAFYGIESLPEVVRYQTFLPRTLSEAERVVEDIIASQSQTPRTHTELAVMAQNRLVGRVGSLAGTEGTNLWYSFHPSVWGRGYAAEAVEALLGALPAHRYVIECDPRNIASWRLAERLGFVRESLTERSFESKGEWVDSLVYAFTKA